MNGEVLLLRNIRSTYFKKDYFSKVCRYLYLSRKNINRFYPIMILNSKKGWVSPICLYQWSASTTILGYLDKKGIWKIGKT